MKAKRITALFCALLLSVSFLPSCGEKPEEPAAVPEASAPSSVPEEAAAPVEEEEEPAHVFPEKDMEGATVTVLTEDWANYDPIAMDDILAEESTGDIMNDSVLDRMNLVNDLYNCTLAQADLTSGDGQAYLKKTVQSGDDAYQIALVRSCQYSDLLTAHVMLELEAVPHVNLSDPWYDANSSEALALLGRNFGVVSNVTMNRYEMTFCAYFNQVLAESLQLDNLFDVVAEGRWTWDTMFTMGELAVQDLDGDGEPTTKDSYGITYINDVPEGLLNAGGVRYASLNAEGIPEITATTEENITKMQFLLEKFQDQNLSINLHQRSKQTSVDEVGMFMNRQSLFSLAGIYYAPQFRDMEDEFGIIPLPKYDESQEYGSPLFGNVFPITLVPVTNTNLDNTGLILDALSYEGWHTLRPAFCDVVLQGKVSRNEESNKMLNLIFDNTFYDSGILFQFGNIVNTVRNIYQSLNGEFASAFAKSQKMMNASINKLVEAVEKAE